MGRLRSGALATYLDLLDPAPVAMVLLAATGFCFAAARGRPVGWRLRSFLVGLLATQCAISLHNHYCDRELDRRTKPWRALPRGLVSPAAALAGAGALTLTGLLAVLPLGFPVLGLLGIGTAAGFSYNAWFKRSRWTWLPFWVALPSLPLCAFAVVGRRGPGLGLAYVIGAPLVLGVYLADSLADLEADAGEGVLGLAHRLVQDELDGYAGQLLDWARSWRSERGPGRGLRGRSIWPRHAALPWRPPSDGRPQAGLTGL